MTVACKKENLTPPIDLNNMNRVVRHKLRNLCAGVKMSIDRIAEQTAESHPFIGEKCSIITSELNNLEVFTDRMDLLFDALPPNNQKSLFELISLARTSFARSFPLCSLAIVGKEYNFIFPRGSWLLLILTEVLHNAGEAAGVNGQVEITWNKSTNLVFTISNTGDLFPADIPTDPPKPFFTNKGRHDGLGLAIVNRICSSMGATLSIDKSNEALVSIKLTFSLEEILDE